MLRVSAAHMTRELGARSPSVAGDQWWGAMAFRSSARVRTLTPSPSAFWAARLLERKEAERALRDDYSEICERIDEQKAQLDAIQERIERESAARGLTALAFHTDQAGHDCSGAGKIQSDAQQAARLEAGGVTTHAVGTEYGELKQRVEQLQAGLQTISDELQRECAARTRVQSALEETQKQLAARVGTRAPQASAYWAARLFERKQAENALRQDYVDLRERLDTQAAALRALHDVLEDESNKRQHTEQALQQVRVELEQREGHTVSSNGACEDTIRRATDALGERITRQASELDAIRDAIQRESDERTGADRAAQRTHEVLNRRLDEHAQVVGRQIEEHGSELRGIRHALEQGAAERATLQQAHADVSRQLNGRRGKRPSSSFVERFFEGRRSKRALRRRQARLRRQLDGQGAELREIRAALERETAERVRAEAVFRQGQEELSGCLRQRGLDLDAGLDAHMAERQRAEQALRRSSGELREYLDQHAKELEKIREALERETSQRTSSDSSLQREQTRLVRCVAEFAMPKETAELHRRVEEQAAELREVRTMLERETGERTRAEGALQQMEERLTQRIGEKVRDAVASAREHDPEGPIDADASQRIERQGEELQAIREALQREGVAREKAQAAFRSAQDRLEARIVGQHEKLRTLRFRLQRALLEKRIAGIAPSLDAAPDNDGRARALLAEIRRDVRIEADRILGMAGLALDTELSAAQRDYLRTMAKSAGTALDVLRRGRSGARGMRGGDVEDVPFGLRDRLRVTLDPLAARARCKGIHLAYHVAPDVPEALEGNATRLQHLLVNLAGNAIKHTASGEIVVTVAVTSRAQSDIVLLFGITDSGGGMPVRRQQRIFEALNSDGQLMMRRATSMDLSLAIAGRLVRSMAGRIWFESDINEGTTFRFTLRLGLHKRIDSLPIGGQLAGQSGLPEPADAVHTSGRPLRFLVADADPGSRSSVVRLFQADGHHVVAVEDGAQALATLEKGCFDLLLMDLRMPRMDAFEAAAAIRARETASGGYVTIVGLAAEQATGDQERCEAVGIDSCIAKPVQAAELYAAVSKSVKRRQKQVPA